MTKPIPRAPFARSNRPSQSGLYVFAEGPGGSAAINMKSVQAIPPFVDHLLSIGRKNVRVGATLETAVSYEEWKAGAGLAGKAAEQTSTE